MRNANKYQYTKNNGKNKYKYKYNTYQKNAILLIAFLFISGSGFGYWSYRDMQERAHQDEKVQVEINSQIGTKKNVDVNAALDDLMKEENEEISSEAKYLDYNAQYQ